MKKISALALLLGLACPAFSQNLPPKIKNFKATPDWLAKTLTLTFDLADPENDPLEIVVQGSTDGGKTFATWTAAGDAGFPVAPVPGKQITCDLSALAGQPLSFAVRLLAFDQHPWDLQWLVNQVDSNRLRQRLRFIEGTRHRSGGPVHLQEVRDSLERHYRGLGYFTEAQPFLYGNYTGKNYLGTRPATGSPNHSVIVDGHYDSVSNGPGADDNGSAVAATLEISALLAPYPTLRNLRFINFDMEEDGLVGSTAYVKTLAATDTVEGVFNFEMIGYFSQKKNSQTAPTGFNILFPAAYAQLQADTFRGNFITNVGNTNSEALINLFQNAAAQYVPSLKSIPLNVPGTGGLVPDLTRSDHAPFWLKNIPALMLTDGANFRNKAYHTAGDTLGILNFTFMANTTKAALAAIAELAGVQHGAWATAAFAASVATGEAGDPCAGALHFWAENRAKLVLQRSGCATGAFLLEIFDGAGRLVFSKKVDAAGDSDVEISLGQALPAGVCFGRIQGENIDWAEQFVVGN